MPTKVRLPGTSLRSCWQLPDPERTCPENYLGEFVRVVIGSTIHGLHVPGTDDLDLMGVRVESMDEALPVKGKRFEQFVWRTQPEGHPSGPGDIDLTVYSINKYVHLAAKGNPTLLNLLFVPPDFRKIDTGLAEELRKLIPYIVSRQAGFRYAGYLRSQRERLVGERGQKRTGYSRREKYLSEDGWDTKYGMHMIRLGIQGIELLTERRITLPMPEADRSVVMEIREGKWPVDNVVMLSHTLEEKLLKLAEGESKLAEHPNWAALQSWMSSVYMRGWTGVSSG